MSEQFGKENHGFPKADNCVGEGGALAPTKREARKRKNRKSEAQRAKEAKRAEAKRAEGGGGRSDTDYCKYAQIKRRKAAGLKLSDEDGTCWKRIKTGWTTAKRQEQNSTKLTSYFKVTKQSMTPAELLEELTASLSDLD